MSKFDKLNFKRVELSPAWDFEKTPELTGIFISTEENVGPNNSKLYNIELEDGTKTSVWGSTVLDVRLKNVKPGEVVKITYLGKEKSDQRKGATYKNYEVYHAELSEDPDLESLAEQVDGDN